MTMDALLHSIDVSGAMVPFLAAFALGIALFHTLIFGGLFAIELKPSWALFVLYPLAVGVAGLIEPAFSALIMVVLFVSTFVFALIGMISAGIRDARAAAKRAPAKPWWVRLLRACLAIAGFSVFFLSGNLFVLLIIAAIIVSWLLPTPKSKFLSMQADLPTSKIRSLAVGLVEVKGRARLGEAMHAPIGDTPCIGYRYVVEDIYKDDNGRETYSVIEQETRCNPFHIEDDSAVVEIAPDGIEFIWLQEDAAYRSGGRRYSQYLLRGGEDVYLIGRYGGDGNTRTIARDMHANVLALAPARSVEHWNLYKPLLNAFIATNMLLALLIACLLVVPIQIDQGRVKIEPGELTWRSLLQRSVHSDTENTPEAITESDDDR
jgi:hypothetical protein